MFRRTAQLSVIAAVGLLALSPLLTSTPANAVRTAAGAKIKEAPKGSLSHRASRPSMTVLRGRAVHRAVNINGGSGSDRIVNISNGVRMARAQNSASGSLSTHPPRRQPTLHNTKNSRFFFPGCGMRRGCRAYPRNTLPIAAAASYACVAASLPSAACAAASLAIGTRNGEHDT
jgi:hypothetical protein